MVRSLLEPSKDIDEKFQSQVFVLATGKVLSGLVKRIDKSATVYSIQDVETLKAAIAALA